MDREYAAKQSQARQVASVAETLYKRRCAALGIRDSNPATALAIIAEAEAVQSEFGHPPSGHLAPITPWREPLDPERVRRLKEDLEARRARNEGGEAAP